MKKLPFVDSSPFRTIVPRASRSRVAQKNSLNPLSQACANGDVVQVLRCIAKGDSLNTVSVDRSTPLHHAINSNAPAADVVEMVRALRDAGARDDLVNAQGQTPLTLTLAGPTNPAVIDALGQPLNANAMLWQVLRQWKGTARGFDQRCRQALRLGADPHALDPTHHQTGLSLAIARDLGAAIARFHTAGVDLNRPGYRGQTALHAAAFEGQLMALYALLHANADVHRVDEHGNTPLHLAGYNPSVVAALLNAGADPHRPNRSLATVWEHLSSTETQGLSTSDVTLRAIAHSYLVEHTVRQERTVLQQTLAEVVKPSASPNVRPRL